ncbi:hypothetical protein J5N97_014471 [Dioscorea zingiberensis]|uniref:Uncharacterized protein n=1 Tax=Dioscorea zingiberensis TaxID=325984 RepID=A0A9D5CU07_9LILI|nr:hypothetical protein J5N97_014471 [Dioscorea zingiberensis]
MGSRRGGVRVEDVKEAACGMPSFVNSLPAAHAIDSEENNMHPSRASDFGVLEQTIGFRVEDAAIINRDSVIDPKSSIQSVASDTLQFGAYSKPLASTDITPLVTRVRPLALPQQRATL